jgi:hypothetical protein
MDKYKINEELKDKYDIKLFFEHLSHHESCKVIVHNLIHQIYFEISLTNLKTPLENLKNVLCTAAAVVALEDVIPSHHYHLIMSRLDRNLISKNEKEKQRKVLSSLELFFFQYYDL